ncbi:PEP/pyruvate-binding domain-containing protein [Agromyces sp. Soil535]|uniref:PEP/pyruvate-binding domain-containing protein n=1 Tax=Agromyces sp. Soil535 TaxID=1736390 RepID=UPI0006F41F33|nr:PEP/pyruvate-binding domain-containing protein [Agromyces sp. Soil535]KRE21763.1 hypothetical protein ASG80_11725 [Agromyces sp. Soil535]
MLEQMKSYRRLDEADAAFGSKAAHLAALRRAGFPVPDGFVLALRGDDRDVADIEEVVRAARERGVDYAVRSSGSHEDQAHEAGAGRYTTILGVRGDDALRDAIARCLASGQGEPMGVVVQEMVDADVAGVAFTVNPVSGAEEIVIEAVAGLGDRLVSGEATPQEWTIAGTRATGSDAASGPLDEGGARLVADWARKAAELFGTPQDVEWAIAGGRVSVLQARPITTLVEQVPIPVDVPPGYWVREPGHARMPRTPLTWSFNENEAVALYAEASGALACLAGRIIGGWMYMTVEPVGAPPPRPGGGDPTPPAWLMPVLLAMSGQARRRMRTSRRVMRDDLAGELVRRWRDEVAPSFRARIADLRDTDLALLTEAELTAHLAAAADLAREGMRMHFTMSIPYEFGTADLAFTCRDLLGWSDEESLELVVGLSEASSAPAHELRRLSRLDDDDPAFDEGLARFQRVYGCRALDLELSQPTLAESPEIIAATLERLRANDYDPDEEARELAKRRAACTAQARAALSPRDRARFDAVLARAELVYPLRDENVFLTIDAPYALVRYAALESGRRLVRRGAIAAADDVFYLDVDELLTAMRGVPDPLGGRIRLRRGERAWALAHPGPTTYGTPPRGEPSFRRLPRSARFPTEAMMWIGSRIVGLEDSTRARPPAGEPLTGIPASPGSYTGPARIVHEETDFHRIRPGDVLVCPSTRPSWSVIFPSLGAVVADSGGSLSHPAIIAREHRLPAVVATGYATSTIVDGQLVTVDGNAGVVTMHAVPAPRRA